MSRVAIGLWGHWFKEGRRAGQSENVNEAADFRILRGRRLFRTFLESSGMIADC